MSTTALLVELLVVGVFATPWCAAALHLFGALPPDGTSMEAEPVFWLLSLAVLYVLGMTVNFLADRTIGRFDQVLAKEFGGKEIVQERRARVLAHSAPAAEYLAVRRSLVRIFRANALNFSLTAVSYAAWPTLYAGYLNIGPWKGLLLFLVLSALSFFAYWVTVRGYFAFVTVTEEQLDVH